MANRKISVFLAMAAVFLVVLAACTTMGTGDATANVRKYSKLRIDSEPRHATVYVDGLYRGMTPKTIYLRTGSHSLTVMKSGYLVYNAEVIMSSGERAEVHAALVRSHEQNECFDSDIRNNPYRKGYVEIHRHGYGQNGRHFDFCYSATQVRQVDCKSDNGFFYVDTASFYNCPHGCTDGRCIEEEEASQAENRLEQASGQVAHYCRDTDGGINYYVRGEIMFCRNVSQLPVRAEECMVMADRCITTDLPGAMGMQKVLLEVYCQDNEPNVREFKCNCQDGACLIYPSEETVPLG